MGRCRSSKACVPHKLIYFVLVWKSEVNKKRVQNL